MLNSHRLVPPGSIPYSEAVQRLDRTETVVFCTDVTWEGVEVEFISLDLPFLGKIELAKIPPLPRGYTMLRHPSWPTDLEDLFPLDRLSNLSFEELDQLVIECEIVSPLCGGRYFEWAEYLYENRRDYSEWTCSFDDAWIEAESYAQEHFQRILKEFVPKEFCINVGPRVMPPPKEELLLQLAHRMMQLAHEQMHAAIVRERQEDAHAVPESIASQNETRCESQACNCEKLEDGTRVS